MAVAQLSGLVHDAFVYRSEEEFLAGTLPFLEAGIESGEPILAAPTAANMQLLQHRLGDLASCVDWAEDPESHRTVERLAIFLDYIHRHLNDGAALVRLLGEPCWPPNGGPGVAEWKRYESYLNVALASYPVWLVCPYDGRRLAPDVVEDVGRTHPNLGYGDGRATSHDYLAPAQFSRTLDRAPLPPPPADAAEESFGGAVGARRFVAGEARAAGLPEDKIRDAELAASEVAANVFRYAADVARIRAWFTDEAFVVDVDDTGRGFDDPFPGYAVPEPTAYAGRGLMMARRLADVVQVRTTPLGARVRLHFSRE
ncbi:MAG TPA: sensor histidine kinase [Gaiellaceae bacterium]|nr:sensor histidine kinase [Gaiellaceae bacterium]